MSGHTSSDFWRTLNLKKDDIPEEVKNLSKKIEVKEGTTTIENATVFYREALPPQDSLNSHITMLLLHGKMFSSKTWLDLGTIHMLAAMGYRTIAIDIPGFGNSPAASIQDRAEFLKYLIEGLNATKPVLVSPSLSGFFTLPFLLKYSDKMGGYVPVAPVGYEVLEELPTQQDIKEKEYICEILRDYLPKKVPDLTKFKVPTMVVFGEKDRSRSSALLCLLPWSQWAEIPNGRHPAYLDDPNLWHKLLFNFLYHVAQLAATKTC